MSADDALPWLESNSIMLTAGFSSDLIKRSNIWAARDKHCPRCGAVPYQACRNLNGIRLLGFALARENKSPHTERVDYDKLVKALKERGYK
jgi:hypothetical protein